ncbi:Hsp20/alpha crystallin family protein [Halalkalicoccus jeotgali]|uniref:Hsp20 n=1 Tax=Halalkalicoccus jeotgali (strain DSM 18796 / CECT 7217 / JCM 14584 / KCTC 4019 / B3) TaxID=795797 RepID=D8J8H2_HALJB|nr:Hsp20 family protein [Halalkalicoccus jeotgali]ADJ16218.1 putative Hsp20 [Halalkalicoccus jeotgali B3]ELY37292.1 putative Hsp20 [Halalkalicoccus jeotgali B3]
MSMKVWEIGKSVGNHVAESVGRVSSRIQESRPLAADLLESDEAYLAVFDAPGVSSGDVQVRFSNGEVLVRLERFREFHDGFEMRLPGRGLSLDGSVRLPEGAAIDAEAATATLKENGTLHVRIPKGESDATTVTIEDTESIDAEPDGRSDDTPV